MKRRLFTALAALTVMVAMASPVAATEPVLQTGGDTAQTGGDGPGAPARAVNTDKLQRADTKVTSYDALKDAEDGIFIVRLTGDPVATYRGDVAGLQATNPTAAGVQRLDAEAPAVRAYADHLRAAQTQVIRSIERAIGRTIDIKFTYRFALNGFAAEFTVDEARRVLRFPEVAAVTPERILHLDTDSGPAWIGAPDLWGADCSGYCGEGVIVGVLDTGINPENPSFAEVGPEDGYVHVNPFGSGTFLGVCDAGDDSYDAGFACNDKLIGAWSFIDYPTSSPIDDDGHGSHTASTAAGNFVAAEIVAPTITLMEDISGVAPHANIIMYDVCDEDGCPNTATNAGIEQAIIDGVDVINYSIGTDSAIDPWVDENALAFLAAREAGVFVATSAGNDGPENDTLGTPAVAPWLTSVGASTHDRKFINTLADMTGGDTTPPADMEGLGVTDGYGPAPIIWAGDVPSAETSTPELCGVGALGDFNSPWDPGTFSGEIVVCERGTFGRVEMGANVLAAGAGGYVLIDNGNGLVGDAHELPGVHITADDGVILKTWLATGAGHMATITGAVKDVSPDNGNIMAGFSSRGSNRVVPIVSPSVAAPGVDIIAADGTGGAVSWGFNSGTSMASPHIAGSAALLMQANPSWSPAQVQSALMLTATTDVRKEDATTPADPFDMGNGVPMLGSAMSSPLVLDETIGNYEAADPALGGDPTTLNLASAANDQCVLTCSWTRTVEATTDGSWDVAASDDGNFVLDVSPASFSLTTGETQEITITADVMLSDVDEWFFGEISITGTGDDMHMPVAVQATRGDLPDQVDIWAYRDAGSVMLPDVTAIEIELLTLELVGLTPATQEVGLEVEPDSNNASPYDDIDDGNLYWVVDVPEGTWRLVAETSDSTAPDLDLFVGTGDTPSEATEVCSSTSGTADEYCNVWDPSGTMWLLVNNWDGSGAEFDTFTFSYAMVGEDQGNMLVEGPPDQPELEPFDMQVYYDLDDPAVGSHWYGAFSVGTSAAEPGNVGRVPVNLMRHEDDVTKTVDDDNPFPGDTVEFTITVSPNTTKTDLYYEIVDHLPEGLSYVPGTATGGLELRNDGALTWQGVMPAVGDPTYAMTTSLTDPFCDTGFGGYVDLAGFAIGTDPSLSGDSFLVESSLLGTTLELYGTPYTSHGMTDDGFMVWGDGYGEFEVDSFPYFPQFLPDDTLKPNNLSAPLWNDYYIVYDAGLNWGMTAAAIPGVVGIVEWDNPWPYDGGGPIGDFEVVHWIRDDTPGFYEIVYAFDNTDMSEIFNNWVDFVTVGLENAAGTDAITYLNQGDPSVITDDLQICFDWVPPLGPPHVMTYQAVVAEGANGFVTNTAWHINNNPGAKQEAASVEVGLGDVTPPWWDGAELTVHDKLSDRLMLEWDAAMDDVAVFAYDVYVNDAMVGTVGPSTFDYNVTGLVPKSFNEFAVVARDEAGNESDPLETSATMATDFIDDDFSIFESDIEWLNGHNITYGCNPPANTMFCPNAYLTRGQLAALINRALKLPYSAVDAYSDDDGNIFEQDINNIAAAGIAHGCGPDSFCPNELATRGQLAAMFKAAFGFPDTATDYATDDDGHLFEDAINSLYAANITSGCAVGKFCPDDPLTRGMVAAFFRRAFRWMGVW